MKRTAGWIRLPVTLAVMALAQAAQAQDCALKLAELETLVAERHDEASQWTEMLERVDARIGRTKSAVLDSFAEQESCDTRIMERLDDIGADLNAARTANDGDDRLDRLDSETGMIAACLASLGTRIEADLATAADGRDQLLVERLGAIATRIRELGAEATQMLQLNWIAAGRQTRLTEAAAQLNTQCVPGDYDY